MWAMGSRCTRMLRDMGFTVKGWSRTPKQLHDIRTFHGMEELPGFLKDTEILISILPLTDATRGILNADLFRQLPKGAFIINAGRGQHLIEQDLLAALDNGHLTAATLDVFDIEPLPPEHAFWSHPKITVTPHIASLTDLATIARNILAHIKGLEKGASPPHQVNRRQQY
jgi:glyoxylate/hydroxypyruvate reductase A